jgi:hypothetical protein
MATVNLARGVATGGLNADGLDRVSVHRRRVEFADITTGAGANGKAIQGDVLQLFHVPSGFMVTGVYWEVVTAEGAVFTFQLGDGADADGYTPTAVNGNATGSGVMLPEGTADGAATGVHDVTWKGYTRGKYYGSSDTVDLTVASGATATTEIGTAVIEVAIVLAELKKGASLR